MSTTTTNYGLKKIDLSDSPPDITVLNPNFDTIDTKLKEAIDKADSAFQSASNGKTDIAAVVGSPVTSGDTFSSIKTKIQTIKNSMATNLSAKGITAAASETLSSLAGKISNILRGQGNVVESQVLQGATFANADGVLRTGTMPNHIGGDNVAASTMGLSGTKVYLTPPSGHAFNGGATFWDEPNLIAANLLSGKSYFGLAGGIPVLTGIRNAAGVAQWGDGALAVYPEQGYQKGGAGDGEIRVTVAQLQAAEPDLVAANFLNTKNIFGVQGGIPVLSPDYSDQHVASNFSFGDYSGEGVPSVYLGMFNGYFLNGVNWIRYSAPNHKPENIRAGVTDLGVTGSYDPLAATLAASNTQIVMFQGSPVQVTNTTWQQKGTAITMTELKGTVRISFMLEVYAPMQYNGDTEEYFGVSPAIQAAVFKNGVQVGTTRAVGPYSASGSQQTFTEDFSFGLGDVFSIRALLISAGTSGGSSLASAYAYNGKAYGTITYPSYGSYYSIG